MSAASGVERVESGGSLLALILRRTFRCDGIAFFTDAEDSQQLGYMNQPSGYVIAPHTHVPVSREVSYTKEVLFVRSGRLRVDFYDADRRYVESTVLAAGDVVLLALGGHGFEMLEPTELVEVKQGPYAGGRDKVRFEPVASDRIRMRGDHE